MVAAVMSLCVHQVVIVGERVRLRAFRGVRAVNPPALVAALRGEVVGLWRLFLFEKFLAVAAVNHAIARNYRAAVDLVDVVIVGLMAANALGRIEVDIYMVWRIRGRSLSAPGRNGLPVQALELF